MRNLKFDLVLVGASRVRSSSIFEAVGISPMRPSLTGKAGPTVDILSLRSRVRPTVLLEAILTKHLAAISAFTKHALRRSRMRSIKHSSRGLRMGSAKHLERGRRMTMSMIHIEARMSV